MKINIKNIQPGSVEAIQLLQFFQNQAKIGIKVWSKGQTYSFSEGDKFTFEHDIFQRDCKQGHHGVRYEVISNQAELGHGNYGQVKLIEGTLAFDESQLRLKEHGSDGSTRVVKIQQHNRNNPFLYVENEIKLSRRADHLAIKDATEQDNISYTVMKKMPGITLHKILIDDFIGSSILTTQERINLTKALASMLYKQASIKGIIHRDIKPENIMVDLNSPIRVNLIDFGLSTTFEDLEGDCAGTEEYIAPEIAYNPWETTVKSDVFSLGRVIALLWGAHINSLYSKIPFSPFAAMEGKLQNLFTNIKNLESNDKDIIFETLVGMLTTQPDERLSIEEVIANFNLLSTNCLTQQDEALTDISNNVIPTLPSLVTMQQTSIYSGLIQPFVPHSPEDDCGSFQESAYSLTNGSGFFQYLTSTTVTSFYPSTVISSSSTLPQSLLPTDSQFSYLTSRLGLFTSEEQPHKGEKDVCTKSYG